MISDTLAGVIITGIVTVLVSLITNRRTNQKVDRYHTDVDGKMEQLLVAKKAEGNLIGQQQKAEESKPLIDAARALGKAEGESQTKDVLIDVLKQTPPLKDQKDPNK